MAAFAPEVIAGIVAASRARCGLPPTVTDPATLDRVAQLVLNASPSSGKTKRHGLTSVASHVLEAGNAARPTG